MAHTQLTLAQRYKISAYLQAGISSRRIAAMVHVHHSTICREVARNSLHGKYSPEAAQQTTKTRQRTARKHRRISSETWHLVDKLLRLDLSPEQISGVFTRSGTRIISHESIYQHVLADKENDGTLFKHLRWSAKKRRKRYGKQDRRGIMPGRVGIEKRPAIVDQKCRVGDWEIDTAIGKGHQGVLIVAVERKSKITLIGWSRHKKALLVTNEIIRLLRPFKRHVLTITVDNGKEFALHKEIAKALKADVFFANPYSAWERGLNENTIGLVRQYFPKNMPLNQIDPERLVMAQNRLNARPRKSLGFRSPNEVFYKSLSVAFET